MGAAPANVLRVCRQDAIRGWEALLHLLHPRQPPIEHFIPSCTRFLRVARLSSSVRGIGTAIVTCSICPSPIQRRAILTLSTSKRRRLLVGTWRCAACASLPARPISFHRSPLRYPKPPDVDLDAIASFAKLLKFDREKCLLPGLHPVHGQLPYLWDRPFSGSAGAGTALLGLRVLRAALSYRGIGYGRVGADH